MCVTVLEDIFRYKVGDIYRYIIRDIYRYIVGNIYIYIVGDIYRYIVRDIYSYILGYIYRHIVGYLQINDKGYLDILNPIMSEMVIGAEGCYRIRACLDFMLSKSYLKAENYVLYIFSAAMIKLIIYNSFMNLDILTFIIQIIAYSYNSLNHIMILFNVSEFRVPQYWTTLFKALKLCIIQCSRTFATGTYKYLTQL